jgi:hypothetical protein
VTPAEVAKALRDYNAWRRADEDRDMPDPAELGKVIDEAVRMLELLAVIHESHNVT